MLHGSSSALENWSATTRFRRDAERQECLLLAALRAVRPGGTVLYSTCSLSPVENDRVVAAVRRHCDKWLAKGRPGPGGVQLDFVVEPFAMAPTADATAAATAATTAAASTPAPAAASPAVAPKSKRGRAAAAAATTASSLPSDATADSTVLMPFGEATEFGWIILPDQPERLAAAAASPAAGSSPAPAPAPSHGFGPIYMCKLRRVAVDPPTDAEDAAISAPGPSRDRTRPASTGRPFAPRRV